MCHLSLRIQIKMLNLNIPREVRHHNLDPGAHIYDFDAQRFCRSIDTHQDEQPQDELSKQPEMLNFCPLCVAEVYALRELPDDTAKICCVSVFGKHRQSTSCIRFGQS